MLAWAALERAVRIARRLDRMAPVARWQRVMDAIHRDVMERGWSERQRSFVQRYGAQNLDGALLFVPVLEFLSGKHPRVLDTMEHLQERLGDRGMLRRFDPRETPGTDPVEEGAFNPCTLWRVSSLARAGRGEEAERLLRRFLETIEPLGLAPEEMDPETGEMLGNYPLLFSQVELVRAGMLLSRSDLEHRARAIALRGAQTSADLFRRVASPVIDVLRWGQGMGLLEGTIAGVIAGVVMSVWKMGQTAVQGKGLWRPPNLIATILLGKAADRYGFTPVPFLVGMTLHLGTSAGMGWIYAALVHPVLGRPDGWHLVLAAVAYALLSWAIYQYLLMPWLAPIMDRDTSPFWLAVAHIVYGVAFAGWILMGQ